MNHFSQRQLVVLDDDKIQHILIRKKIQLITSEVQLHFFESAEKVLTFLRNHSVDIVITDLNLDTMDGWDFVEELDRLGFKGKLFVLTGSIMASDRLRAQNDSRISGFFEKPISDTDLIQILAP
ncbi:MAG: response regulator [Algoriphagus aquaeductus]|jgi:CheY-like chemotaxis protein|uniref:response regulator n=1 Tax=Algoriphagus TaxID=246875 RepID=UPI00258A9A17|nr:response regulator [Algoriphagus sp.]